MRPWRYALMLVLLSAVIGMGLELLGVAREDAAR